MVTQYIIGSPQADHKQNKSPRCSYNGRYGITSIDSAILAREMLFTLCYLNDGF